MRGAYLLSLDEKFFGEVASILVGEGTKYWPGDGEMVQFTDPDDRLFTLYGAAADRYFLEDWAEPVKPAGPSVQVPDLKAVAVCSVDCRWPDLFVTLVERLARQISQPMWVLDEMDVLWNADAIDVNRLVL